MSDFWPKGLWSYKLYFLRLPHVLLLEQKAGELFVDMIRVSWSLLGHSDFGWEKCEGWRWLELLPFLGRVSLSQFLWVNEINAGSQSKAIFNNLTQENDPTLEAPNREIMCLVNCLRAARGCIIHIREWYRVGTRMLKTTWSHTSRRCAFGCLPWQRESNSQRTIT